MKSDILCGRVARGAQGTVTTTMLPIWAPAATWVPTATFTVANTKDSGTGFSSDKFIGFANDKTGDLMLRQLTVFTPGATDSDGLLGVWELQLFGNLLRDGTGDFDTDGMLDQAEHLAGTLPNDPTSVLKILPNPSVTGGGVTIQWQSIAGKTYRLQFKNSLSGAGWQPVPGDVPASGAAASKTDTTVTGQLNRFYRVVLIP